MQSLDPRVFERTTGSGIEIKPIEFEELEQAIALRVTRFHKTHTGKPPLTSDTHRSLFEASFGEVRFVFKYSNSICTKFVEKVRTSTLQDPAIKQVQSHPNFKTAFEKSLHEAIGRILMNEQLPHQTAASFLQTIVEGELKDLFLKQKEKEVLYGIGKTGHARASDFKNFSLRSMQDFSSNYLSKLYAQNLLTRQQEGRAVTYRLRGVALLSYSFGLLDGAK